MNKHSNIPFGKIVALLFLIMIMAAVPMALAGQTGESEIDPEGGKPGMELVKEKVTIEKKYKEKMTTKFGDVFAASKTTLIIGANGQQVSIYDMRVPCTAEVTYRVKNGVKVAHRIHIKRVLSDATDQLSYDKPE